MDVENPVPGRLFAIVELEEIHFDRTLADTPIRTPILPWQTNMFWPAIFKNKDPVAGCNSISMENRENVCSEADVNEFEARLEIVRVILLSKVIPEPNFTSNMLSDIQLVASAPDSCRRSRAE